MNIDRKGINLEEANGMWRGDDVGSLSKRGW